MGPWKSPGPDGFPAGFLQNYWSVVGEELTKSTLNFLNGGAILKETNSFLFLRKLFLLLYPISRAQKDIKGVSITRNGPEISHLLSLMIVTFSFI
ncbi:hypothetical protein LIER_10710 [Lithospermum erythrorhizon]|uniref:Reverse transcriptase n=1 Tax=Lithospermum erythrorhizon TaxID=34254 RepID=A0AAV3PLL7_LITER